MREEVGSVYTAFTGSFQTVCDILSGIMQHVGNLVPPKMVLDTSVVVAIDVIVVAVFVAAVLMSLLMRLSLSL